MKGELAAIYYGRYLHLASTFAGNYPVATEPDQWSGSAQDRAKRMSHNYGAARVVFKSGEETLYVQGTYYAHKSVDGGIRFG